MQVYLDWLFIGFASPFGLGWWNRVFGNYFHFRFRERKYLRLNLSDSGCSHTGLGGADGVQPGEVLFDYNVVIKDQAENTNNS